MVKGWIRNKEETYTWLLVWRNLALPPEIAMHVSNYLFDLVILCDECGKQKPIRINHTMIIDMFSRNITDGFCNWRCYVKFVTDHPVF